MTLCVSHNIYFATRNPKLVNSSSIIGRKPAAHVIPTSTPMFFAGYPCVLLPPSAAYASVMANAGVESSSSSTATQ
jgi:hypothetical protein